LNTETHNPLVDVGDLLYLQEKRRGIANQSGRCCHLLLPTFLFADHLEKAAFVDHLEKKMYAYVDAQLRRFVVCRISAVRGLEFCGN
jgi:hypothetical protein